MSAQSEASAVQRRGDPWVYSPWLDLLVGCGAWSAPLLAIAAWVNPSDPHAWNVGFYLLAVIFNYPHFMATIYRAYRTREDFEKYKFFTLHLTLLLALTSVLLHASARLIPWVFTLYICWSPWHYSGQNFGLLLMFVRRGGKTITNGERRFLRGAFVASYLMLLASFETGGSSDPLILSLGLPARFTIFARLFLGAIFLIFGSLALQRLVRESSLRSVAAPVTLLLTQFLWFVLPTFLELHAQFQIPQTRYSSGILAVLHSTQYLWITSYYQRREARARGESSWGMVAYFVALVAGGIALFIPGPWLVSYAFHFDFTTSFLIFSALVNIHHFMLDGAIWKLRDSRIASVLIDRYGKTAPSATAQGPSDQPQKNLPGRWLGDSPFSKPAIRIGLVGLLFLWGGLDQLHFALGTDDGNLSALLRAAQMNPYDSMTEERLASAEMKEGRRSQAIEALGRALAANPRNVALQEAYARATIEGGRYQEAYEEYQKLLALSPHDPNALINCGLLADRLGHPDVAIDSWGKAVEADPNQPRAELYLAAALDKKGDYAAAAQHRDAFLKFAETHPDDPAAIASQRISAAIQLGDDDVRISQSAIVIAKYESAIGLAQQFADTRLESAALAHLADLQEKLGSIQDSARSYQRGLALDSKTGEPLSEGIDWFNYGQFLRRHGLSNELAYACFLRAENLLEGTGGPELETVRGIRQQLGRSLGQKAAAAQKDLPALLARAAELPQDSF